MQVASLIDSSFPLLNNRNESNDSNEHWTREFQLVAYIMMIGTLAIKITEVKHGLLQSSKQLM